MDTLQNFIDGRWTDAPERAPAINPATGQQIAWLPKSDRAIARDAIAAAKGARAGWAKTSVWKRAEMCVAIAASIDESRARIARTLSQEQGKPLSQATGEVAKAAGGFRLAAELVRQMKGETLPAEDPTKLIMTLRQPRGVYAVITPWNIWDLDSPPAIRSSGFRRRRLRWPPSSSCERSRPQVCLPVCSIS
jgi:acyl-CoA reductase-like NAD-dependent aldehyde dehydrogenase